MFIREHTQFKSSDLRGQFLSSLVEMGYLAPKWAENWGTMSGNGHKGPEISKK